MTTTRTTPFPADPQFEAARQEAERRTPPPNGRDISIVGVIRELRDDSVTLLRQEVALIRAEATEKVKDAGRDAGKVAGGGLVAYGGVLLVLVGVCLLATYGLVVGGIEPLPAGFLSFVIIGGITAAIGYFVARSGMSRLGHEDITPTHTVGSLRENAQWVKEKTS